MNGKNSSHFSVIIPKILKRVINFLPKECIKFVQADYGISDNDIIYCHERRFRKMKTKKGVTFYVVISSWGVIGILDLRIMKAIISRKSQLEFIIKEYDSNFNPTGISFQISIPVNVSYRRTLLSLIRTLNLGNFTNRIDQFIDYRQVDPTRKGWYSQTATISKFLIMKIAASVLSRFGRNRSESKWHVKYGLVADGNLREMHWSTIENPKGRYFADPFLWEHKGKTYLFVEDFDELLQKGNISVLEIGYPGYRFLGTALREDFHLSFPWIFQVADEIFMSPESTEAGGIRIYRSVRFPLEWELVREAVPGVRGADPMIFQHNEVWWLFCNTNTTRTGDFCYELDIYFSNDPIHGKWISHPMNPVYQGFSKARNAGLIRKNGETYRVAQIQGFMHYGQGIAINLIQRLDENYFNEVEIENYVQFFDSTSRGNHHLSISTEFVAVDVFLNSNKK